MEIIDVKTAKAMVEHYQTTRKDLIDKTYGINDTNSTWISVDSMKDFLNKLPADATGFRIYLAAYNATDKPYPDQTTIVVVGTVSDGEGGDVDPITSDVAAAVNAPLDPYNKTKICPPEC